MNLPDGLSVIDRRHHIAGNAADRIDDNGVLVHQYGPHLFHTNAEDVFAWLQRFAAWTPYCHRVRARLPDARLVPLPINLDTINTVFDTAFTSATDTRDFLRRIATPIAAPRNAAEYLASEIGTELTDLFFRRYTRKMWAVELEDLHPSVVKRLPLRHDRSDQYFNDRHQALPRDGYTSLIAAMLDHPAISVTTGCAFVPGMERDAHFCFNAMPIDEYFDYRLGPLPYRSLRFHHQTHYAWDGLPWAVRNYTDASPYTRETWWHCLPAHHRVETGRRTMTLEEPCDALENGHERYYPVRTADDRFQLRYRAYRDLADRLPNMIFIGRCGTYQYLDMDQVVAQSLGGARRWLAMAG